jgi:hypothetical protein
MAQHPFWCLLWIDGAWVDVTTSVRQTHPVRVLKGGGEVSEAPRPSSLTLTFNDPIGTFRPDRAESPLYGKIGRNTPISVPSGIFEVSAWKPDRTVDHDPDTGRGDQTCEIEAGGLLRRVGQWAAPVISPFDETVLEIFGDRVVGHWRLDDKAGSRYPAYQVGLPDESVFSYNMTFGSEDGPPGANTVVRMEASSALSGVATRAAAGSAWSIAFAFKLDRQPTTVNPDNRLFFSDTTNGAVVDLWISATEYDLQISNGGAITHITGLHNRPPVFWTFMQIMATPSGGSTNFELDWYSLGGDTIYFATGSVGYLVAEPRRWQISSNDATERGLFSQVVMVAGGFIDQMNTTTIAGFNGRPGELAGARFERLMEAAGLGWEILGDPDLTTPMGAQTPGPLLEQLKIIRDTEDGILFDTPGLLSITLRARHDLYAQTPALELDGQAAQVGPPFVPVLDDLNTQNVITVAQVIGGEYTVRDDTGPMGTQPSPDGVGEYKQKIDVCMKYDADLRPRGEWALAQGTNPEARYQSLVIDLDADPSLESECDDLLPGDRVTVANVDPDLIDLMVVGIQDMYDTQFRRRVKLTCRPYAPYAVGKFDDTVRRFDSNSTTVEALTTTETIWDLTITNPRDGWSTTATPYDVVVGGEVCRCTSMGAMTGSGPWAQQGTFTRSINGVVKSHDLGTPVHIANPARWAL